MARLSKEPEERKNEIMDMAEAIFEAKGFENTTVSDIVKEVGVAQGLFYYYFKSKNQILDAIADRLLKNIISDIENITNDKALNPMGKVNKIIDIIAGTAMHTGKFIHHGNDGKNSFLHLRFEKKIMGKLVPLLIKIIEEGVSEHIFDTEYPAEVSKLILVGIGHFHNDVSIDTRQTNDALEDNMKILKEIVRKILGVKEELLS